MTQLTAFGKEVYKWLIDNGHSTDWLCAEINGATGLFCDRSYLAKILRGKRNAPNIVDAIENICGIKKT